MLSFALDTLRSRLNSVLATFLSLALGVAVVMSMAVVLFSALSPPTPAPQRYPDAPVVVRAKTQPVVRTAAGEATLLTTRAVAVPEEVVRDVPGAVRDRLFYAQVADRSGPEPVGRPWSAARFSGYRLESGSEPRADTQVVVPTATGVRVGDAVTVLTADGAARYTVSGLSSGVDWESPVFFGDGRAERLAPRVSALLTDQDAEVVRRAVGDRAEVLTGAERVRADRDPNRNSEAVIGVISMTATAIGIALCVVAFVVASSFAFAVNQRRREFGLLRSIGMTPAQVRRMVLAEAGMVSAGAAVIGCVLGLFGGPLLAAGLRGSGVAPSWFEADSVILPFLLTFLVGVGVAQLAVWSAARRASRTSAMEVLREAAVERSPAVSARLVWGVILLIAGIAIIAFVRLAAPWMATISLVYAPIVMMPIIGIALLAPTLVKPLARVITLPLRGLTSAVGMVVRENVLTAAGRAAATAAPVLLVVGLSASLLGTMQTSAKASLVALRDSVRAEFVLRPASAPVLNREALNRLARVPGVDVVSWAPTTVYLPYGQSHPGEEITGLPAAAVDPKGLAGALGPVLVGGSLDGFGDDSVVLDEDLGRAVGDEVELWLADGSRATVTVAAVLRGGALDGEVLISAKHAGEALPTLAYAKLRDGADPAATRAALEAAGAQAGVTVVSTPDWVASADVSDSDSIAFGILMILGIIVTYSVISVVSVQVMAGADRRAGVAMLRLAGGTRRQVLLVVLGEAFIVAVIGVVLGVIATWINLFGLRLALEPLAGRVPTILPLATVAAITVGCLLLTLLAAVLPAAGSLRKGLIESARGPER